jgi:membrane-associated phospholipid phosphatase
MPVSSGEQQSRRYPARLAGLSRLWLAQLVRAPSDPRHEAAARQMRRQVAWLLALGAVVVVALMVGLDATEIGWMPRRGTPSLWPVRILTDFGKDAYVLCTLGGLLLAIALAVPLSRAGARHRLLRVGVDVQYLFLAVSIPVTVAQVVKWAVGRGRPFVGGKADAFNFAPFDGTEAYFSLPSGHAVTAFALAFGVAAIWPRARIAMAVYAVVIAMTRLLLLAHHPSDVVAGAVIGVVGAIGARHWFAVRRLGFAVGAKGEIAPL